MTLAYSNREVDSKFTGMTDKIEEIRNLVEASNADRNKRLDAFEYDMRNAMTRFEIGQTEIKEQTTKHNGRMSKIERNMLIIGTATLVIVALKFPELLALIKVL